MSFAPSIATKAASIIAAASLALAVAGLGVVPSQAFAEEEGEQTSAAEALSTLRSMFFSEGDAEVVEAEPAPAAETPEAAPDEAAQEGVYVFEGLPATLIDTPECSLTVTSITVDEDDGEVDVEVQLVNNTQNAVMFGLDTAAVNGWMLDPYWANEVDAGETETESIEWSAADLEALGIESLTEIQLDLRAYNSDDWSVDDYAGGLYVIYPEGADAATTTTPTYAPEDVLVDANGCVVALLGQAKTQVWGDDVYQLVIYVENNTASTVRVAPDNESVDGWMMGTFYGSTLFPGTKALLTPYWSYEDMEAIGITEPTDIEFQLNLYDYDTYEDFFDGYLAVYPQGEAAASSVAWTPLPTDNVLVDTENVNFTVLGYNPEGSWGYEMIVLLENKTDTTVMYAFDDVYVNGIECDPYWACTVAPGKSQIATISWGSYKFEEAGITDVSDISFTLRAYDNDDWSVDDFVQGEYSVQP